MKIRPAQILRVTKQAARKGIPGLAGLAALFMAFLPSHAAQAQSLPGPDAAPAPDHLAVQPGFRHILAATRQQSDAALLTYKVKAGQSMSSIAAGQCHGQAKDWTGIYAASRSAHLTGRDANQISTGQELAISCQYLPGQLKFADHPHVQVATAAAHRTSGGGGGNLSYGHPNFCGDGDGDGWDVNCATRHHASPSAVPQFRQARTTVSFGNVNPDNYSGFQRCVITRESGGNSQVMNASGHYGLYQFSASTWQAYGGSAGSFGHASASEQTRVFDNAMAQGGQSNWSPYDGC
jgi:hypothetical protein